MKTYLPHYFKKIGISFVIVAAILSTIANINDFINGCNDGWNKGWNSPHSTTVIEKSNVEIISIELGKTLTWISLLVSFSGFLMYMFSKEKIEDEFVQKLRYMSLGKSLLITWIIASLLFLINGDIKLEGFYILQFQLIVYVIIYYHYRNHKFV